eukprot:scaffold6070_cov295-Pinguiococcus_pyrenoidosus.AAC.8
MSPVEACSFWTSFSARIGMSEKSAMMFRVFVRFRCASPTRRRRRYARKVTPPRSHSSLTDVKRVRSSSKAGPIIVT